MVSFAFHGFHRPGRFDEVLSVPVPDAAGRLEILTIHTGKMPLAGDVSLCALAAACAGWSGAQLSGLCREAGMYALRQSVDAPCVQQRHFEAALSGVHG